MFSHLAKSLIVFLVLVGASKARAENDLGYQQTATIQAEVFEATESSSGSHKLFLRVSSAYTNTLACTGSVAVDLVEADGSIMTRDLVFESMPIFPRGAFGADDGVFEVNTSGLISGSAVLKQGFSKALSVTCKGWDLARSLDNSICRSPKINPGHASACKMLYPGQKLYWFQINGLLLGSCRCD